MSSQNLQSAAFQSVVGGSVGGFQSVSRIIGGFRDLFESLIDVKRVLTPSERPLYFFHFFQRPI